MDDVDGLDQLQALQDKLPIDLSFDTSSLIAGILFGIVGLWLFRHGKKNNNRLNYWLGIALMVYPYVVRGVWANWGVGVALCAVAFYYWD